MSDKIYLGEGRGELQYKMAESRNGNAFPLRKIDCCHHKHPKMNFTFVSYLSNVLCRRGTASLGRLKNQFEEYFGWIQIWRFCFHEILLKLKNPNLELIFSYVSTRRWEFGDVFVRKRGFRYDLWYLQNMHQCFCAKRSLRPSASQNHVFRPFVRSSVRPFVRPDFRRLLRGGYEGWTHACGQGCWIMNLIIFEIVSLFFEKVLEVYISMCQFF